MSKYYRKIGSMYSPVEVDDIPKVKALREAYQECVETSDPWHPASEPPKPEDFEPTGRILAIYAGGMPDLVKEWQLTRLKNLMHWRKITPPKE